MDIRLIAFDLDDTLLRDDLSVGDEDLEAIAEARARGILIAPASGRRLSAMLDTLCAMDHRGPVLTLNGARAVEYPALTPLYERFIDLPTCLEVAGAAKELGAYLQVYLDEDFEYERDCDLSALYASLSGGGGRAVGDLEAYLRAQGRPSQKLLFIERDPGRMARLRELIFGRFGDRLSVFHSKAMYLELTHPEASKGAALAAIAREKGILREQVMAIGDGENDLPMLEYAGLGVAVANAGEHVRSLADALTAGNMHGGVGQAIRKYALGGDMA